MGRGVPAVCCLIVSIDKGIEQTATPSRFGRGHLQGT